MTDANTSLPAFVVDLDGTLCRTDTLEEGLLRLAGQAPMALPRIAQALSRGRAALKSELADHGVVSGDSLPLNTDVIARVQAARDAGRETALVTAADQRQADAVAGALPGLFDRVTGSTADRNLKGPEKARYLTETYGERGFDYVGDSSADIPVWAAARHAIAVDASPTLEREMRRANENAEVLSQRPDYTWPLLKAMRPYQWSKNVLIFLPAFAAHDLSALPLLILAFLAFSLTASSVYLLNDLLDLSSDRAHPRKRERPFAAGTLPLRTGLFVAGGLLALTALISAVVIGPAFLGVLVIYFAATTLYSFWLKKKLIIDVITLAGLYTVRIVAGAAAASVTLSPWMLGFSMFIFLALAAMKRQAELTDQVATGRDVSGRAYRGEDLPILRGIALSASQVAILVLALYTASPDVRLLYTRPDVLWAVLPPLLYWLLRMVIKTHRGEMSDDPIVFAAKDRVSQLTVASAIAIVLVAI